MFSGMVIRNANGSSRKRIAFIARSRQLVGFASRAGSNRAPSTPPSAAQGIEGSGGQERCRPGSGGFGSASLDVTHLDDDTIAPYADRSDGGGGVRGSTLWE